MGVSVNYLAVAVAAAAQFVVGAIWYMPLFGTLWGQIHEFDLKSMTKEEQQKAQRDMVPLLAVQFLMGLISTVVLAHFIAAFTSESWWKVVLWLWFGFVVTTQVGAVLFGGTKPPWIAPKIAVMAGGSLVSFLVAGAILNSWR